MYIILALHFGVECFVVLFCINIQYAPGQTLNAHDVKDWMTSVQFAKKIYVGPRSGILDLGGNPSEFAGWFAV